MINITVAENEINIHNVFLQYMPLFRIMYDYKPIGRVYVYGQRTRQRILQSRETIISIHYCTLSKSQFACLEIEAIYLNIPLPPYSRLIPLSIDLVYYVMRYRRYIHYIISISALFLIRLYQNLQKFKAVLGKVWTTIRYFPQAESIN